MKRRLSTVVPLASALMLVLGVAACAPSGGPQASSGIENGVIVDDLRRPQTRNY